MKNNMILKAQNLHKSYQTPEGPLPILKGVNLELAEGSLTFIIGRSGSGKSTLLHVLGSLDTFDQGSVEIEGQALGKMGESKKCRLRNEKLGFVFQMYHLLPELTLLENVMLPGLIGKKTQKLKERARALLAEVGLSDRDRHLPQQLSGGEQQRAALVRALVNEPKIVFCDEPTGNLDEENSEKIVELIRKLRDEHRQTFCIVTHDEWLAERGDRLYRLSSGKMENVQHQKLKEQL